MKDTHLRLPTQVSYHRKKRRGVLAHNKSICFKQTLSALLNCAKNSLYNHPGSAEAGNPAGLGQAGASDQLDSHFHQSPSPRGPRNWEGMPAGSNHSNIVQMTLNMPQTRMLTRTFFFQ